MQTDSAREVRDERVASDRRKTCGEYVHLVIYDEQQPTADG